MLQPSKQLFITDLSNRCRSPVNGINTEPVRPGVITYVNDTYLYNCLKGYEADFRVSKCNLNGRWSPKPSVCKSTVIQYYNILIMLYIFYQNETSCVKTYARQQVNFEITSDSNKKLYIYLCGLITSHSAKCLLRFNFCFTEIVCKKPSKGVNTKPVADVTFRYSDIYQYECAKGYETSNETEARCQWNRTWSIPPPTCIGQ